MSENYFAELAKIDVREHTEKKGKFSYLSWAWAVDVLRKADPTATWEVMRFDGMPFMETKYGIFVEVAVTVKGITLSQIHPVLDNNNRPIAQPNAFQINTSLQRCLVKAIALHGLGLYIYAGEDLPEGAEEQPKGEEPPNEDLKAIKEASDQNMSTSEVTKPTKLSPVLKAKYQTVYGSLDGIEEYISKHKKNAETLLTEALMKKAQQQKGA